MTDIKVPNVGESVTEVTIAQWFKSEGDAVKKDEPLVELETDKAAQELVAPEDGVLTKIKVAEGENAGVGDVIAVLGEGSGDSASDGSGDKTEEVQADADVNDSGNASMIDIEVPSVGESVTEATLATWMKKEGDPVKKDEPLLELETDKAAQELVSPADGVLAEVLVGEDETVTPGTVVARVRAGAGAGKATPNAGTDSAPGTSTGKASSGKDPMPAAARIIKEENLDPSSIEGTGKDSRITKGDALKAASAPKKESKPAAPSAPRETGEREERVRMSRLRQTIARRLKGAQDTAAILTTFNEADMTEIMATRKKYQEIFIKKHGIKLGFMSFFVKAVCTALKEIPAVNAEIDGTDIIYKNYYDIGVAVGTDKGLVVPVLRDADTLSLAEIEKGIAALGGKARDGELTMEEMTGGTFTISNGGVYGSLMSTPILNPPQSGILGMHTIQQRPMAIDGEVKIRPMMYLALSYDHRIVDGKEAVTFLVRVKECLENPERMLLDL